MALVRSRIAITWHDGEWPSTAGARALLAADELVDEGAPLSGLVEQLVQSAEFVRGPAPAVWPRGNRTSSLEWERAVPMPRHDAALAAALAEAEHLPAGAGWVLVELEDYGRAWAVAPAAVRQVGWRFDPRDLHLRLRYGLDCGPPAEVAAEAEEGALLLEPGWGFLTEEGDPLMLETYAPDPES